MTLVALAEKLKRRLHNLNRAIVRLASKVLGALRGDPDQRIHRVN